MQGAQRLGVIRVTGGIVAQTGQVRRRGVQGVDRQPAMRQDHAGLGPEHAAMKVGRRLARWFGLPAPATQRGQVVFQTPEMKLHALLHPLRVGNVLALRLVRLKPLEVQHQHHNGRQQQHQQAEQPQQGAPVSPQRAFIDALQQFEIE